MNSLWSRGGYPVHLFLDRISEQWICGLCNNVIRSTVSTKCDHIFCFSCVRVWLERYGTCPFDCGRTEVSQLKLVPDIDLEIEAQFIRCPRYKFGCYRILRLGDLILHEKVCTSTPASRTATPSPRKDKGTMQITLFSNPGEPLGFHIAGGQKQQVYVSSVVRGLPADRAGLKAGDSLIEVNSKNVRFRSHQEVVHLIRTCSSPITLTVDRQEAKPINGIETRVSSEGTPTHLVGSSDRDSGMGKSEFSASSQQLLRVSKPVQGPGPSNNFGRNQAVRMSLRSEAEIKRSSHKKTRARKQSLDTLKDDHEFEILEVVLHRSAGTRLGITLGFDRLKRESKVFILQILPDGVAAKDGRLKEGDIIVRINGFETHDTEEALLMFLEQDPTITITVQRPKMDSCAMRRVDSCGSLDSKTHPPSPEDPKESNICPTPISRILSPQERNSPLKHFSPHNPPPSRPIRHDQKDKAILRGSPRRAARVRRDLGKAQLLREPFNVVHLRAKSAPETTV